VPVNGGGSVAIRTPGIFPWEAFLDEVAHAGAGRIPTSCAGNCWANQPRMLAVLELAEEKANWGIEAAAGSGPGHRRTFLLRQLRGASGGGSVAKDGAVPRASRGVRGRLRNGD